MPDAAELNRIAGEIIGGAIHVHRRVGNGCLETAYVPCLATELLRRNLDFVREKPIPLRYGDLIVPRAYVADFIVEGAVVVEVKAVRALTAVDERQLQTYLRLTGCPLGLILNFGAATLTEGIRRRVNNFPYGTPPGVVDPIAEPAAE